MSRRTPWPSATVESPAAHPLRAYLQPTPAPACHLAPSQRHEQSTSTSKSTALHCTALHCTARSVSAMAAGTVQGTHPAAIEGGTGQRLGHAIIIAAGVCALVASFVTFM